MEENQNQFRIGEDSNRSRTIVKGVSSLTFQSALNAVLGFVLIGSLLRFLPSADYGSYSAVQVTVGIAGVLSGFGLSSAAVHFLAPSASDDGGFGWGAAKAAIFLTVALSAIISLALAVASPLLSNYFLKGPSEAWVFYMGAVWLFTSSVSTPIQALLQGLRRYTLLAKVLLGSRFISVAIAVAGVVFYRSLTIAIASLVIYAVLIFFASLPYIWGSLRLADPSPYYSVVIRYAFPLGLAGLVGAVAGNADIVVVGGYLDPVSLAIYNATIVISSVLAAFFVSPLVTALFAETSLSSESENEVRIGTSLAIRFTMVTLLPASLLAAAMAPQLVDLFSSGGAYAQGVPYLELITLFYLFAALQTVSLTILQGVGRTRQVLVVGVITSAAEIGLSVSLVPTYGLAGAAASRVLVMVLGAAVSVYFMRGYLKGFADYRFVGKALLSASVPALAVFALSTAVSNRTLSLLPYSFLGVALFLVCAKGLRLLSAEDRAFLEQSMPSQLRWVSRLL